jgi:hypothetical protein
LVLYVSFDELFRDSSDKSSWKGCGFAWIDDGEANRQVGDRWRLYLYVSIAFLERSREARDRNLHGQFHGKSVGNGPREVVLQEKRVALKSKLFVKWSKLFVNWSKL